MRTPLLLLTTFVLIAASSLAGCSTLSGAKGPDPLDRESRLLGKFLSGRFADRAIEPAAAVKAYSAGLTDAPGNHILLEGALNAALTAGDRASAISLSEIARAGASDMPQAWLVSGAQALAIGDAKRAAALAQRAAGTPMDDIAGRMLRAWGLAASGEKDAALLALQQADPRLRSAGLGGLLDDQRALLLLYLGEPARAAEHFERAGGVPLRLNGVTLRQAQAQRASGHPDIAAATLAARTAQGSNLQLAQAAQRLAAGEELAGALTAPEGAALGIASFGIALAGSVSPLNYVPYVTLARIADPAADEISLIAAEAHRELGDAAASLAAVNGIGTASPYASAADVQRALLLQDDGDTAGAIAAGERAALSGQRSAMTALAGFYRQTENWEKANEVYDRLIATAPKQDWTLFFLRGAALERLKRWPEAERDLRQAMELSPDQPEVLNYLGYTWVDRGVNLKQGLALLERAVELEPEAGHIIDSLGWAKFRLKRNEEAVDLLERAALILPGDVTVNDHLGDAYWSVGRKREAGFQWHHALSLAKPEEAEPLRRKLKDKGFVEKPSLASAAKP